MTNHSLISQCWSSTMLEILYCALKVSMLSRVSTSLANLPMKFYGKINVNPCKIKMGVRTHLQAMKIFLLGKLLQLKLPKCINEVKPAPSPPYIEVKYER